MLPKTPRLRFSLDQCAANCRRIRQLADRILHDRLVDIFYALKANRCEAVQETIFNEGIGTEVMSEWELYSAISKGVRIVLNGYYKTDAMLKAAVMRDVVMINIESQEELVRIHRYAAECEKRVNVGIRIRTRAGGKLGFPIDELPLINNGRYPHCVIRGLHFHLGWNIREDADVEHVLELVTRYSQVLSDSGHTIDTVNCGGSFCEMATDPSQLMRRLQQYQKSLPQNIRHIHLEPGRYLVGDCGTLETTVVEIRNRHYCLDSCAYAYRLNSATPQVSIIPHRYRSKDYPQCVTFAGHWPCEEDILTIDHLEYTPRLGDTVLFHNLGAYCDGLGGQFEFNAGLQYSFETRLSRLQKSLPQARVAIVLRHWDFLKDRFARLPKHRNEKIIVLGGMRALLSEKTGWTEEEITRFLQSYYDDPCVLRRELVHFGFMTRSNNHYTCCPV